MKPRSAVATFIVTNALANIKAADVHKHAERFKIKPPPLKKKEKARVEAILDFYRGKIAHLLATTPYEGDYAEVPGFDPLPKDGTTTSNGAGSTTFAPDADVAKGDPSTDAQTEAARRIGDAAGIVFGHLLGGAPVTINVTVGDVTIGDVSADSAS